MEKTIFNQYGVVLRTCTPKEVKCVGDIPNIGYDVGQVSHYFSLLSPNGKIFPEGEVAPLWQKKLMAEIMLALQEHHGARFSHDLHEMIGKQVWKTLTHEANCIRNFNRLQSVKNFWHIHLHLPGGLIVKVRERMEGDDRLNIHGFFYKTHWGDFTMVVNSLCRDALGGAWNFCPHLFQQMLIKCIEEHYPFMLGIFDKLETIRWPGVAKGEIHV